MNCGCTTEPCQDVETERNGATHDVPAIVDEKVTLLIAAGAAMAANSDACLEKVVSRLIEKGVPEPQIRMAVEVGQTVKDKPAALMKEVADVLTGTDLSEKPESKGCPAEKLEGGEVYNLTMLIAAGSAMAANCEPCINQAVPNLIEAGVGDVDIRRAVEIGQFVKDQAFAVMKEAADLLTGSRFLDQPVSEACSADAANRGAGCCDSIRETTHPSQETEQ